MTEKKKIAVKEEFLKKVKNLNFLLTELNFFTKSLKREVINEKVFNYITSIDKKKATHHHYQFIAHIKLVFKLQSIYENYKNDAEFFKQASVILRLYFKMSGDLCELVGNVFMSEENELKDLLKGFVGYFNELKEMDILDYLVLTYDDVESAIESNDNLESDMTENQDKKLKEMTGRFPVLTTEEKRVFHELFAMAEGVLAHFLLVYVFFEETRDYIVE